MIAITGKINELVITGSMASCCASPESRYYRVFGKSGVRIEIVYRQPATGADVATVLCLNHYFFNWLAMDVNVYLASARLAAVAALIGKLLTPEEYQLFMEQVDKTALDTCRYLNFDRINQYTKKAWGVISQTEV